LCQEESLAIVPGTIARVSIVANSATATGLEWQAPAGGGKVLQVVSVSYNTETTVSSASYTDTGLTLNITPSSASSKILVLVGQGAKQNNSSTPPYTIAKMQLVRTSTALLTDFTGVLQAKETTGNNLGSNTYFGFSYLDSPATTSATTYKTQVKYGTNAIACVAQYDSTPSTLTLIEIGA
jgi:hypothetical protein